MKTYLCCAHAGGQGKTTLAQLLYVSTKRAGISMKLNAADFLDESRRSKIGKFYPDLVTEFGIGSDLSDAKKMNDLNTSLKYWDKLGATLIEGGAIIDLGANVISQVIQWAEARRAANVLTGRGAPPISIMLVCRAERRAIDDMSDLVKRFSSGNVLPVGQMCVVMNEAGGGFDGLGLEDTLAAVAGGTKITYVRLPRCTSELWPLLEQNYVSIEDAIAMGEDEAADRLGADVWSAMTGIEDLNAWVDGFFSELKSKKVI